MPRNIEIKARIESVEALEPFAAALGYLVESEVYPQKLTERGLEYVRPSEEERAGINRIISMKDFAC